MSLRIIQDKYLLFALQLIAHFIWSLVPLGVIIFDLFLNWVFWNDHDIP